MTTKRFKLEQIVTLDLVQIAAPISCCQGRVRKLKLSFSFVPRDAMIFALNSVVSWRFPWYGEQSFVFSAVIPPSEGSRIHAKKHLENLHTCNLHFRFDWRDYPLAMGAWWRTGLRSATTGGAGPASGITS